MTPTGPRSDTRRSAGWLPDPESVAAWVEDLRREIAVAGDDAPWHPVVREFENLIERDALVRMQLERMIDEVPQGPGHPARHLQDLPEMLRMLNAVLSTAPEYSQDSMVMTPVQAVLDQTTATPSGLAAYRNPTVNTMLGKVLTAWCAHLDSPDSLSVLDVEDGWTSPAAAAAIGIEQYQHDPDDEHWGFTSWNDFFTRRFREGERPVEAPEDDKVVVSACESTPYALARDVQRHDRFWLKSQPYSLQDMLAGDPAVEEFVGGTVYQAYLSATDYHRWHAPVAGTIERAFVIGGTYYSDADTEGADATIPQDSQGYMAHVAARAVILIRADDPVLGLVGFVPVGMADVSSCLIGEGIVPGAHVAKGDELGRFQFGGSTHCLLFRPGAIADIAHQALPRDEAATTPLVHVRSRIATAAG